MKLPFTILTRRRAVSMQNEMLDLRKENAILSRELRSLRTRFAGQILYGATAPKDAISASRAAAANIEAREK